jgi:hypothetical protein
MVAGKLPGADGRRTMGENTSLSRDIYGIRRSVILQTDCFSLILRSLPHQLIVAFVTVGWLDTTVHALRPKDKLQFTLKKCLNFFALRLWNFAFYATNLGCQS